MNCRICDKGNNQILTVREGVDTISDISSSEGDYYICINYRLFCGRNDKYILCENHLNTPSWIQHYRNNILVEKKVGNRVYSCNNKPTIPGEGKKVGNRVYYNKPEPVATFKKKVGNRVYDSNYYNDDY